MPTSDESFRAVVALENEAAARLVLDALSESFNSADVIVAAAEAPDKRWTVSLDFREPPNTTAVRALVALAAGAGTANALRFESVAATDWVARSLEGLSPVEAGRFVVHGAHDRARVAPNRIGIEIEAALAFGTGHHGTTRGCLLALDRLARRRPGPRRVLDLGTGSGVLAIAAARALRRPVVASDNDPLAVRIARANARRNRAGGWIEFIAAEGLHGRRLRVRAPFGLVFANILLAPLKRLAGPLAQLAGPHGRIILSGLLVAQQNAALAAYRTHGLQLERRIRLDEWVTLVLRAPSRGTRRERPGPVAARARGQ